MRRPTPLKKEIGLTRKEIKNRIKDIKELNGCVDCGAKNHIVLDFDHIKEKKYNVSRMVHDGFSWEAIKKEIAKNRRGGVFHCSIHKLLNGNLAIVFPRKWDANFLFKKINHLGAFCIR